MPGSRSRASHADVSDARRQLVATKGDRSLQKGHAPDVVSQANGNPSSPTPGPQQGPLSTAAESIPAAWAPDAEVIYSKNNLARVWVRRQDMSALAQVEATLQGERLWVDV